MPGSRGAIAKYLLKWLVIPVVLAAIGFFVVGPRLGAPGETPKIDTDPSKGLPPVDDTGNSSKFKEPDVDVTSRPAGRRPRRSSRRASTPPRTTVARQEQSVPSPDEEPPF